MRTKSLVTAALLHVLLIGGLAIALHPRLQPRPAPIRLAMLPSEAVPDLPVAAKPPELGRPELPPAPTVEPLPPPEPDVIEEPEEPEEPEAEKMPARIDRRATPADARWSATRGLLHPLRPRRSLPPPAAPAPPPPAPAAVALRMPSAYTAPEALDAENRRPVYPRRARRLGLEAEVLLEVTVSAQGAVIDVRVLVSAGPRPIQAEFDRAAVAALRRWRYQPAVRDGVAVEARIRVPVEFRLR